MVLTIIRAAGFMTACLVAASGAGKLYARETAGRVIAGTMLACLMLPAPGFGIKRSVCAISGTLIQAEGVKKLAQVGRNARGNVPRLAIGAFLYATGLAATAASVVYAEFAGTADMAVFAVRALLYIAGNILAAEGTGKIIAGRKKKMKAKGMPFLIAGAALVFLSFSWSVVWALRGAAVSLIAFIAYKGIYKNTFLYEANWQTEAYILIFLAAAGAACLLLLR